MMKQGLGILILLLSFNAKACVIETYSQLIKINKIVDDSIILKSDCSEDQNGKFIQFIQNASGSINATHLERVIFQESGDEVAIKPQSIIVKELNEVVQNSIQNPALIVKNTTSLYSKSVLTLRQNDKLTINCKSCSSAGRKNIKLTVNTNDVWVTANILRKTYALKLNKSLSFHSPILTKDDFEAVEVLGKGHQKYFSDLENLKFYKLNKNLEAGALLKFNDVSPKKLITAGQKVNMLVKGETINLKYVGTAVKSGKIGDFIQIKNPRSNKIIIGRVIDFNTAVVEL